MGFSGCFLTVASLFKRRVDRTMSINISINSSDRPASLDILTFVPTGDRHTLLVFLLQALFAELLCSHPFSSEASSCAMLDTIVPFAKTEV